MKASYKDIKERIKDPILWFDENGTPRYAKFHPNLSPNIYAREVVLLEISCQYCHRRFDVEMSFGIFDQLKDITIKSLKERLKNFIENKEKITPIHYGDPPIHDCPGGGTTMNCYDLRIKQFWSRKFEWRRLKRYEIELEKEE